MKQKPTIVLPVKYTNSWLPQNTLLCPASCSLDVTLTQRCFAVRQLSGSHQTGSGQRNAVSPFASYSDIPYSQSLTTPVTALTPSMQITGLCGVTPSSVEADIQSGTCCLRCLGRRFLRNVGTYIPEHVALTKRRGI